MPIISESSPSSRSVLGTIGLVLVAIVVLSAVDAFLARTERSENLAESNRLADAGRMLMQTNHPLDAVAQLKAAIAIERENPGYWLSLGEAQLAAGQLADAEATLTDLLRRDSTAGAVNLALARVLVKEGRIIDAVSEYHRAIYGHWDRDAETNRVSARFELVNLLAQQGSKEELLAELLPLLDVAPDDVEVRRKLGRLFLAAGSAPRAAEIFREILRQHPQDVDAYAGLGESEFARGNYQTARMDFQVAENLRPSDPALSARLELCTQVLALDPMRRGIGPAEQYRRSLQMLDLASSSIARCAPGISQPGVSQPGPSQPGLSPEDQDSVDEAQKAIKSRVASSEMSATVETNLNLAEDLWKIRERTCKQAPTGAEEPLRLVLAKIAQ